MIFPYVLLLVTLPIIVPVVLGHGSCPDLKMPCRNSTDCVSISDVCTMYHDCLDGHGHLLECHACLPEGPDNVHCLTFINDHYAFHCVTEREVHDRKIICLNIEEKKSAGDQCPVTHIRCSDGRCIPERKKCDENVITTTFSPPKIMDSCSKAENTFRCATTGFSTHRRCISPRQICDQYVDCPDGDDEADCIDNCASNTCGANMDCIDRSSHRSLCRCHQQGYHPVIKSSVSLNLICEDYDECNDQDRSFCSYGCLNTDGGYNCSCPGGFVLNDATRSCRSKDDDWSKPNLIVLFDSSIRFFHISNVTHHRSSQLFSPISLRQDHHIKHIQYDPSEHFILYYDSSQDTLFCHSQMTMQSVALIVNQKIDHFTYDPARKNLFFIESSTNRLYVYHPITCHPSSSMKVHSWPLNHLPQPIRSIQIDSSQARLIYASDNELFTTSFVDMNSTRQVYRSDRPILKFNYDITFQRIFWTTAPIPTDQHFTLYTCNGQFQQCHDTFVRLPVSWPFTFSDDGLIYPLASLQLLRRTQLFGQQRFASKVLTTAEENIRLLFAISHHVNKGADPCVENGREQCRDQICVPLSSARFTCVAVENFARPQYAENVQNVDPILPDPIAANPSAHKKKMGGVAKFFVRLLSACLFGCVFGILYGIGKRIYRHRRQQAFARSLQQHEQRLTIDEPILDEFNVTTEDRHGDRLPLTNQLNY